MATWKPVRRRLSCPLYDDHHIRWSRANHQYLTWSSAPMTHETSILGRFGPISTDFDRLRQILADFDPISGEQIISGADFCRFRSEVCRFRSISVDFSRFWSISIRFWLKSTEIGRNRSKSINIGRNRPKSAEIGPKSAEIGSIHQWAGIFLIRV